MDLIWGRKNYKKARFFRCPDRKNAQPDAWISTGDTCNIQHHTAVLLTFLLQHSISSTPAFSFPVDINFGWPRKSVTQSNQHKYWNIYISQFYNNSTHVNFPKLNSLLPIQLPNILLLNFKHILIITNTIIRIFLFLLLIYLPPITKTIQVRRTRHTGHCWRKRDEVISDVLL